MNTKDLSKEAILSLKEGNKASFVSAINTILDNKSKEVVDSYFNPPEKVQENVDDLVDKSVNEITESDLETNFDEYSEIVLDYPSGESITVSEEELQKIASAYHKLNEENKKAFITDINSDLVEDAKKLITFCTELKEDAIAE